MVCLWSGRGWWSGWGDRCAFGQGGVIGVPLVRVG